MEITIMKKEIKGFEDYFISEDGKVYNKENFEIKQRKSSNGYMRFNVRTKTTKYEKPKTLTTHRAVAEAFIPIIKDKPYINHKDGDKTNNNVNNLEWCTASENSQHSFDNKLQVNKKGNDSPFAISILQYDMQNNFIKEWGCIITVEQTLNLSKGSINKCAKGKLKNAGGFVWKYKGGGLPL
jgi:hypothetical protein